MWDELIYPHPPKAERPRHFTFSAYVVHVACCLVANILLGGWGKYTAAASSSQ